MVTTTAAVPYSLGASIQLAISGIAIVLIALAMLAVLVVLMGKLIGGKAPAPKVAAPISAPKAVPTAPVTPAIPVGMTALPEGQSKGDINLFEVEDRTAALLMAIVADATETPLNQLYFRSIREVK